MLALSSSSSLSLWHASSWRALLDPRHHDHLLVWRSPIWSSILESGCVLYPTMTTAKFICRKVGATSWYIHGQPNPHATPCCAQRRVCPVWASCHCPLYCDMASINQCIECYNQDHRRVHLFLLTTILLIEQSRSSSAP